MQNYFTSSIVAIAKRQYDLYDLALTKIKSIICFEGFMFLKRAGCASCNTRSVHSENVDSELKTRMLGNEWVAQLPAKAYETLSSILLLSEENFDSEKEIEMITLVINTWYSYTPGISGFKASQTKQILQSSIKANYF